MKKILQRTCFLIAALCPLWFVGSIYLMFYLSGTNRAPSTFDVLGLWGFLVAGPIGFLSALLFLLMTPKKPRTYTSVLVLLAGIGLFLVNIGISGLILMRFLQTL